MSNATSPVTWHLAPRIKILHVHTLPVISGSGLNTFLSMRGQRDAGYTVELACLPGGSLVDLVERAGMRVQPIRHFRQPVHLWHDLCAVIELRRLCRRERYTIVHTHNSKAGFLGRLAARLAGVPIIIHTVHGFAFHEREPWWRRQLFIGLERLAARWCDQFIMISQPLIEWAVAVRIAPQEKMVKIYSGIELEQFQRPMDVAEVRWLLGWPPDAVIIGEVAKLWAGKGHDVLLHAFAQLHAEFPQARLLFIGEGEEQPALEALSQELDLTSVVRFLGFRQDVPTLTQVIDVAVLPSLFEGMGRAVLEAMACGKPVVASRVGGLVELVDDGVNGFLVPPADTVALVSALRQLLQEEGLRVRMGQAGRRKVTEQFDAAVMSGQILIVYRQWMRRKGMHE